jgi:hypothetical protein
MPFYAMGDFMVKFYAMGDFMVKFYDKIGKVLARKQRN